MKVRNLHIIQKTWVNACRFLLAVAFIFSGFVKAVDPLGFQYKIQDYLEELYYTDNRAYSYTESFLKMFYLFFGQAYSRGYLDVTVSALLRQILRPYADAQGQGNGVDKTSVSRLLLSTYSQT